MMHPSGYIVGLGDRHAQNILIDQSTAELVHIDLGVAFEQGKTLRTPEVVPFRLTRGTTVIMQSVFIIILDIAIILQCCLCCSLYFSDIIDGMGITGSEGVFRRCCEETMKVLRANHTALLTILEVFIHDPLYRWAVRCFSVLRSFRYLVACMYCVGADCCCCHYRHSCHHCKPCDCSVMRTTWRKPLMWR